jgi:hypothetical protein
MDRLNDLINELRARSGDADADAYPLGLAEPLVPQGSKATA